jgi:protein TonB
MFETVAPAAFARPDRRVFYQTLPVSLTTHALAAGAILLGALWNVEFPAQSPALVRAYALVATPPPPPPPPPAHRAEPRAAAPKIARAQRSVELAPAVIPDTIPQVVEEPPVSDARVVAEPAAEEAGGGAADPGGVPGGVAGGVTLPASPPDNRLHVPRSQPLPMKAIRQEYPPYPEEARLRGYEDSITVRYVIGKNGRVTEITVIDPPYRRMFEDIVRKTLRDWRFTPYVNESGGVEEVVHELQVNFALR